MNKRSIFELMARMKHAMNQADPFKVAEDLEREAGDDPRAVKALARLLALEHAERLLAQARLAEEHARVEDLLEYLEIDGPIHSEHRQTQGSQNG